jgi:hypothetical protein
MTLIVGNNITTKDPEFHRGQAYALEQGINALQRSEGPSVADPLRVQLDGTLWPAVGAMETEFGRGPKMDPDRFMGQHLRAHTAAKWLTEQLATHDIHVRPSHMDPRLPRAPMETPKSALEGRPRIQMPPIRRPGT